MKKSPSSFLKRWWLLIAIVVIIVAIMGFNMAGFRLGPGLSIVRVGTLVIEDLPTDASIYVDEIYNRRTAGGEARITLLPGSHTIIVSLDGHQPWNELVSVESDLETRVSPIIVPVKFAGRILAADEVAAGRALIQQAVLPTAAKPLALEGGCALVSVNGNRIIASAATTDSCTPPPYLCTEDACGPTVIFTPVEKIYSVIQYPGREDTLVVSVGNTLFILELDPREPEFFAPILSRNSAPKAAAWSESSIVVQSGTDFFEVRL